MHNSLRIDYAEIPDNYSDAEIAHISRSHYTNITQSLRSHYAKITQTLLIHYAKIMQRLRNYYASPLRSIAQFNTQFITQFH